MNINELINRISNSFLVRNQGLEYLLAKQIVTDYLKGKNIQPDNKYLHLLSGILARVLDSSNVITTLLWCVICYSGIRDFIHDIPMVFCYEWRIFLLEQQLFLTKIKLIFIYDLGFIYGFLSCGLLVYLLILPQYKKK